MDSDRYNRLMFNKFQAFERQFSPSLQIAQNLTQFCRILQVEIYGDFSNLYA